MHICTGTKGAINGGMLDEPIPVEKRLIKIGVGEYFYRAEEVKEWAREEVLCSDVFGMDDWGRRVGDGSVEEPILAQSDDEDFEIIEDGDDIDDDDN